MKYIRKTNNYFIDEEYYFSKEGLFNCYFGHKLSKAKKAKINYIKKALLKQFKGA